MLSMLPMFVRTSALFALVASISCGVSGFVPGKFEKFVAIELVSSPDFGVPSSYTKKLFLSSSVKRTLTSTSE